MPIYVYECDECGHSDEDFQSLHSKPHTICPMCRNIGTYHRIPTVTHTNIKEFYKPIELHSLGLAHADEIAAFQRRNPDVPISTDPNDPLYGVPRARTRKEKLEILKKEGYVEIK